MLNPKIDFIFRRLFGSEENKDILLSLVNSVVDPAPPIVDLTIKNPFNMAEYRKDKVSVLDIKAVDENGTWFDIEMQVEAHRLYGRRAIYYLSKTYTGQLESGEDYSNLNTTIGIHLLDFKYFEDDRVLRQFVLKDVETNDAPEDLNGIRLYFLEMGKFNKDWSEVRTLLDRWVSFLNKASGLDRTNLPRELSAEPAVAKALAQLEIMGLDRETREIYEAEEKRRMLDSIQLRDAEERGIERGIALGEARGIALGEARGKRESICRLGISRFGPPDASSRSLLDAIDSAERLDALLIRVIEAKSWNDLLSQ